MEWIKVSDRLPEDERMVLVFGNTEGGLPILITMARLRNNDWDIHGQLGWNLLTDSYWHFEDEKITHWMPLPPCPINK